MPPSTDRRAADLLALGLVALMAAALFTRLADFPGLHGDEAWVGLFALRLKARGLYTPHEMNTYTGALYGWLVAKVFARLGTGVWPLRLPGAAANVAAWLVFWRVSRRAAGAWGGLAWCALAAASGFIVLKSRVAWEVYALQPLFLALALDGASRSLAGGGRAAALELLYACLLGVQNHFIFLSVPAALAAAAAALYARRREERWLGFLVLSLANLGQCALLFVVKPLVTEASWPACRAPLLAAFWLAPWAALAAAEASSRGRGALAGLFAEPRSAAIVPWLRRAFVLLVALFFWFHWVPLIRVFSGAAVVERLAALRLPDAVLLALYVWAAGLLAAALADGFARLGDGAAGLEPPAALLAVLPAVYAAVFVVFRNTSSGRYYVLLLHLLVLALAAGLPRWRWPRRLELLTPAASAAVGLHALFWYAALGPQDRPPMLVSMGWHHDKSHDFLVKDALFERLEREKVCRVVYDESMIDLPIVFHQAAHPPPACDPAKAVRTRYCGDCGTPPYIEAVVVSSPP